MSANQFEADAAYALDHLASSHSIDCRYDEEPGDGCTCGIDVAIAGVQRLLEVARLGAAMAQLQRITRTHVVTILPPVGDTADGHPQTLEVELVRPDPKGYAGWGGSILEAWEAEAGDTLASLVAQLGTETDPKPEWLAQPNGNGNENGAVSAPSEDS